MNDLECFKNIGYQKTSTPKRTTLHVSGTTFNFNERGVEDERS
jgi:hypothetical protein